MRVLVPPAFAARENLDEDLAGFYEYYALHSEPWDGPAGLVMCDGRYAACTLDRNGQRPERWALSDDNHLIAASEAGLWDLPASRVVAKGRVGPGEMLAVDFARHRLLRDADIDAINRARAPFRDWLRAGVSYLESDLIDPSLAAEPLPPDELHRYQKLYGLTREERESVLKVIAELEAEATGSMGDDTPIAAMSHQVRPLFDRFRQAFAQVTNPPIDPLREKLVMSLVTQFGPEGNVLELKPENARQVLVNSPILSQRKLRQLLALPQFEGTPRFDLQYAPEEGLEAALRRLCRDTAEAVRAGHALVFLSDRYPARNTLPVHALLAVGAVHAHLVEQGLRCQCNLLVETATPRDPHQFACLVGFGATAIYPWLAYQSLFELGREGRIGADRHEIGRSYRRGIRKGLLKILSKMGISTIAGYRGGKSFDIVGLAREVVDLCFPGTPSRIGGAGFAELEADQRVLAAEAWEQARPLRVGGLYKFVHGGEYHMYNPDVIGTLQKAVRSGRTEDWRAYADAVDRRPPSALRDLLAPQPLGAPLALDEVEPAEAILKRFDSAGMSLGALSPEAHEALAIAMNRLGARSNSGEGGEDPARYGTEKMSKIKQVASGRFGVTPAYLVNAEVLQIKIAQGAKPGEGGQLPGHKVDATIARLRYATPGIGLTSPPPHHDIYSIEDLAQLIHDLKNANPSARVHVKLVSEVGIGTVAAGVSKAHADVVLVSGHDGGTGASPLTSLKHAGGPWELGLAETQQTLLLNGLRDRIVVQTDGQLKTGRDVVIAALLGAEEFGFATAPLVVSGCVMMRVCHLDTCPVGVATQNPVLRERFSGKPEFVVNFFEFIAEEVRQYLAELGFRSIDEAVGHAELLDVAGAIDHWKADGLDLSPIFAVPSIPDGASRKQVVEQDHGLDRALDNTLIQLCEGALLDGSPVKFEIPVRNVNRTVGTMLGSMVTRRYGGEGLPDGTIDLTFTGSAGQSFGAFVPRGMTLRLEGDANDYVGKGLSGGRIVVRPAQEARFDASQQIIAGNVIGYGATSGEIYLRGQVGERFCVRNSGASAVVEGVGDHGCEYMTGGKVVVLGPTGRNFAAGMSGGYAFVLDLDEGRVNPELVELGPVEGDAATELHDLVRRHHEETGSTVAAALLDDWENSLTRFTEVMPSDYKRVLEARAEALEEGLS